MRDIRALPLVVSLAASLFASSAAAQTTDTVGISVRKEAGTETCPSAKVLTPAIAARLKKSMLALATAQITVVFRKLDTDYAAEIGVQTPDGRAAGSRSIRAAADNDANPCRTLAGAVALAIALQVDPEASLEEPDTQGGPPKTPLPPPSPPPSLPVGDVRREPAPAAGGTPVHIGVGPTAASGALPGVFTGLSLRTTVDLREHVSFDLNVRHFPEARTDDQRFGFGLSMLGLGVCGSIRTKEKRPIWGSLDACARLSGGEIHSVVYRPIPTNPGGQFWLGAEASLRGSISPLPYFELGIEGTALFSVTRRVFRADGEVNAVFSQAVLAPVATFYAGLHFP